jgi:hypothetical protein
MKNPGILWPLPADPFIVLSQFLILARFPVVKVTQPRPHRPSIVFDDATWAKLRDANRKSILLPWSDFDIKRLMV